MRFLKRKGSGFRYIKHTLFLVLIGLTCSYRSQRNQTLLMYSYGQAWNQTEQTEQRVRSGSAQWLACLVRLARWRVFVCDTEQPNRVEGLLGSARWLCMLSSACSVV